ncbi:D-aminoacylase, partial [Patescibacteria group bacterium]
RIALSPLNKGLARQKISDIAADQGKSVEEVVIDILLASGGRVVTSMEVLSEKNVTAAIHHPLSMVASNGAGYSLDHRATGELVHPRNFGSFPKFLGTYVRDLKLLKWEEAIHKVTGKPAKKFNIPKRGVLRKGNFADVAVIHPKKIQSAANIENPYQYPEGVNWVLVNGEIVVQNGVLSGARPGKVIRKSHLFF